ncbi:hypothetical protein V8C37DRAFT_47487 [Trichoderma ceciliae]
MAGCSAAIYKDDETTAHVLDRPWGVPLPVSALLKAKRSPYPCLGPSWSRSMSKSRSRSRSGLIFSSLFFSFSYFLFSPLLFSPLLFSPSAPLLLFLLLLLSSSSFPLPLLLHHHHHNHTPHSVVRILVLITRRREGEAQQERRIGAGGSTMTMSGHVANSSLRVSAEPRPLLQRLEAPANGPPAPRPLSSIGLKLLRRDGASHRPQKMHDLVRRHTRRANGEASWLAVSDACEYSYSTD